MASNLRSVSHLVQNKCFIDGKWVAAKDGSQFEVLNPANGSVVGCVPDFNTEEVETAIQAAHSAFQTWRHRTAKERSDMLRKWFNLIIENRDELAKILTAENGKTLSESAGEISYGANFLEWFAEEARRTYGDVIPSPAANKKMVVIKQPVGVAAMITPFNFPFAMITRKIAPALAAGCTVVVRPSEETPLSALALAKLAEEAGFPAGIVNIVTTSRERAVEAGKVLTTHPLVNKISFTGSTAVGKSLLKQAADTVKRVSLELGGNAPFIVFNSANVEKAVAGAISGKFRNSGQVCISANRIFVQDGIHDKFVEELHKAMLKFQLGDGANDGTTIGPLINKKACEKVSSLVEDAKSCGAEVHTGGKVHDLGGNFYEPTLLTNITPQMRVSSEEIFGPVACIVKFNSEEAAVAVANSTRMGLAGYFYSEDISQCWRVAEAMECGMVGINEVAISTPEVPFGGMKESGMGREGSKYGIDEFLEMKYMCWGV